MITIKAEGFQFDELKNGNPVQIRTIVTAKESDQIRKGNFVEIANNSELLKATILNDPIVVQKENEKGLQELAVEVSTDFAES